MESLSEGANKNESRQQEMHGRGLGIDIKAGSPSDLRKSPSPSLRRVPVGGRATSDQEPPDSAKLLTSPPSTGGLTGSTQYDAAFEDFDFSYSPSKLMESQSRTSLRSTKAPSVYPSSERSLLHRSVTASIRDQFDGFAPRHVCNSSKHFQKGMNHWMALTIVILSIFSTMFSCIFLIIALRAPRYSQSIKTDGVMTISTAAFLTSVFAKMIELLFVTVVVAFIGQSLARRAYRKEAHPGVTLAEMSMRNWVVQPGNMFTHWQSVRYAAGSWLGVIALISAVMAMLYTSAATALVQPQLKFGPWERRTLQGEFVTQFANVEYIQSKCPTPITQNLDADDTRMEACISVEHASQAYHNYMHWIEHWSDVSFAANGTRDLATRPKGWALVNDNTTIIAPWIEQMDPYVWKNTGWVINNVTMAMPHPGVVSAGADRRNLIMQPNELDGLGIYSIRASVLGPYVNVLCATGMAADTLTPLVYDMWSDVVKLNTSSWPEQLVYSDNHPYPYLGGTPFDEIFKWGPDYEAAGWPPVFAKLPNEYNTLANDTAHIGGYGREAIYVLGKGGPVDAMGWSTSTNHALCQLPVGQTPKCSTQYNASSAVGTLEAICEYPNDDLAFIKSIPNANTSVSAEWPNVGSDWVTGLSLNLNSGIIDANAANARMWTEFVCVNYSSTDPDTGRVSLPIGLPSPAEALAVMSGCTLVQSALGAPFVNTEFKYSSNNGIIDPGKIELFNASVHQQQYVSGGTPGYQRGFHVVLFAVFAINVIILPYWFVHRQWYSDFSDPINLFSLAINSPPSEKLAACSCGPLGPQKGARFKHYWKLGSEGGHVIMESPDVEEFDVDANTRRRTGFSETFKMVKSPAARAVTWFKKSKT